jgi:hypothetical protein
MATLTQTIKIETEGADKAAEEFKAIGVAAEKSAQQGTDGFEKFNAAAAKIGSTAQDAGAALGQLGEPISKMGEAVSNAAPAMSQFKQAAVGAADGLKGIFSAFQSTTQAGQGIAVVTSGISKIGTAAQTAASSAGTLGVALQAASAALGPFGTALSPVLGTLTSAGLALTTFAAAIPLVTSALGFATPALVAFAVAIGPIGLAVIGITIALGALAAAFYFAAGGARENAAALKELSQSTGRSAETLKQQQQAFVESGGSAKSYVDILKNAMAVLAELGPKMAQMTRESAENVKATAEQALLVEKKLIEARQKLEAEGGPRVSFEDNARLIDINRQLEAASQGRAKAAREVEQAEVASGAASAKAAQAAADNWGPLVEKMRAVAAGAKDITFDSLTTAETKIKAAAFALGEAQKNGTATNETARNLVLTLNGIDPAKISQGLKVPEGEIEKIRQIDAILKDTTQKPIPNAFQWISQAIDSVMALIGPKAAEAKASVDSATTTPAANAWQWLPQTYNSAAGQIDPAAAQAAAAEATTTPAPGAWQWVVDAWNAMLAKLGIGGGAPGAPGGGGSGFAGGGLLGGRGSGTSDSNLAWLSRGEYVVPARAVQQPGVLALLEALRLGGGNLRGFALGGLIAPTLSLPAFAGGGAMNHVTIQFPGLPEITGLRASSAVVDELRKAAAMAQVRSGGRKPSRYS